MKAVVSNNKAQFTEAVLFIRFFPNNIFCTLLHRKMMSALRCVMSSRASATLATCSTKQNVVVCYKLFSTHDKNSVTPEASPAGAAANG